jgi:ParB family transcriptional regulator, chromosome partitioning protein
VIVAGERRYRAAKQAKLKEVPAQVRDADGDALTLAVAENVIRADLTPVEEAEAYRRLVEEHGTAAKVAKLVRRSEKLIRDRLDLLRLPDEARALRPNCGLARGAPRGLRGFPDRPRRGGGRRARGRLARRQRAAG